MDGQTDLANLDHLDAIERGVKPPPDEQPSPHDTKTRARCLLPLLTIAGVTTADKLGAAQ
jgi:hypothetical protein